MVMVDVFGALSLWLGGRKGIRPVKNMGDGGGEHWLVRNSGWSEAQPDSQCVCLC